MHNLTLYIGAQATSTRDCLHRPSTREIKDWGSKELLLVAIYSYKYACVMQLTCGSYARHQFLAGYLEQKTAGISKLHSLIHCKKIVGHAVYTL